MEYRKSTNGWKIAFFSLVIVQLLLLMTVVTIVFQQVISQPVGREFTPPNIIEKTGARFVIITTKEDINFWLQQELAKEDDSDQYNLYIDDAVYMETQVEVFRAEIPIELKLVPKVTPEGNLELQEDGFRIGNFELPSERVFQLVGATIELPDWFYIIPEERKFYLNVRDGLSEEFEIKIIAFDLERNNIEVQVIYLEKTGEEES